MLTPNKELTTLLQSYDADILTNQAIWPHHVSKDIIVSPSTVQEFQVFYLLWNDVLNWLKPREYLSSFFSSEFYMAVLNSNHKPIRGISVAWDGLTSCTGCGLRM